MQHVESFPALDALPGVAARFFGRIPGVNVTVEKEEALHRLNPFRRGQLGECGLRDYPLITAEQIHGTGVAMISQTYPQHIGGVDGLATVTRGLTLGIHVADCAPVWIVARDGSAGALLHSGKKGSELGIVPEGIALLCGEAALSPADLIVLIGPCIRPPCYEIDFATEIHQQALDAGVIDVVDAHTCTACHPDLYYSYRREKGMTGRMLATLTLLPA